jgi:hypothetical protein
MIPSLLMTADDFRRIALSMQGAVEGAHMGHPDFRANGRIFCTLHADDEWGTVMLTPEEQREFMRLHPRLFEPASGAWGRQGSTNVRLAAANEATARAAIMLAWQRIVLKGPSRRSSKTATPRAKTPRKK